MNVDVSPIINRSYYIKQSNPSWNWIKLGNRHIGLKNDHVGCYVCSMAMIICWYLGNDNIETKVAVLNKLAANCSSGGSYNGRSITYNGRTFKPIIITDMAQELLNGYPSICKVGNSDKDSHFAVINGYDAKNASYLTLDPGWSYNNLEEVMAKKKTRKILSKRFILKV